MRHMSLVRPLEVVSSMQKVIGEKWNTERQSLPVVAICMHRAAALATRWSAELLPVIKVLSRLIINVIKMGFSENGCIGRCLSKEVPPHSWTSFTYRFGQVTTHEDPRGSLASAILAGSNETAASSKHIHAKHNILYLARNSEVVMAGVEHFKTLTLGLDEARFPNCQVLQCFTSAPIKAELAAGCTLPPQVMPEISISLKELKVPMRISNALGKGLKRPKRGAKPHADPGVPSWHVVVSVDNALKSFLKDGLRFFEPGCNGPRGPLRLIPGCGGQYEYHDGRWEAVLAAEACEGAEPCGAAEASGDEAWLLAGGLRKRIQGAPPYPRASLLLLLSRILWYRICCCRCCLPPNNSNNCSSSNRTRNTMDLVQDFLKVQAVG